MKMTGIKNKIILNFFEPHYSNRRFGEKTAPFILTIVVMLLTSTVIAAETSSFPQWIIESAREYSPSQDMPQALHELISQYPSSLIARQPKTQSTSQDQVISWTLDRALELRFEDVIAYSIGYRPSSPDIGYQGVLVIKNKQKTVFLRNGEDFFPLYTEKRVPALSVINSDNGRFIMFKSFSHQTQESGLRTISFKGNVISYLRTMGNNEYRIEDSDGDGVVEVSGFGIYLDGQPEQAGEASSENSTQIRKLAREMGNDKFSMHAYLGTGAAGMYQVYIIDKEGELRPVRGKQWSELYKNEAQQLLPYFQTELIKPENENRVISALVSFMGLLEGIGDEGIAREIYFQLPEKLRKRMKPIVIARYWTILGFPKLTQYSWIKI